MERVFLSDKEQKKYLVKKGDLLFARQSLVAAGAGKCSIVNNILEPTTFESHLIRVRLDETRCCPRYYYYLFKLPDNPIKTIVNQCAQAGIRGSELQKIKVPLPMLAEQHRIASILSAYDNLIENNNRRIRLLEQMAENLYKEWFVRFRFSGHEKVEFENGLPKGWKVWKIKNVVKRLPFNRTYKEFELEKEGKVIVIDQSTDEYLGFHNNAPSHKANYEKPILLFGDHSCKFQIMTCDFSLGENVIPFTTNNSELVNDYWLFYATHKRIVTEEYKRHWGRFSSMKILVPNVCLQRDFASFIRRIEKEKNALHQASSLLARQRDLLLPRLMSGKLEV